MNRPLRCAIYTRKSSEEGLDQTFNSLDAQREACAAYIQSQRHEGWKLLPAHYDDGGYSGGTLDRPAMRQLLADVTAGSVDLIVVYKVDRLTRSLSDFAKIVDQLDQKKVSFVSVTQSFNTTTSMGRLTLNVLLSFAQFEREVTGERIRDKIAASKKKGMWMGGLVPLGYDTADRKLTVNPDEAEQVRHLFRRYLDLGSVAPLRDELKAQGLRSKRRSTKAGGTYGGCAMTSGALFTILTNPVYRGEIRHRGVCYPGQHDAIVPEELWNAAQELREQTRRAASTLPKAQAKHPLLGLLTDEHDRRYQAVHTTKGHRRYRYYVAKATDADSTNARYPADELEQHVADRIHHFFAGPRNVLDNLLDADDAPKTVKAALQSAEGLKPAKCGAAWSIWRPLMRDVCISPNALTIRLDRQKIRALLGLTPSTDETSTPSTIDLVQPMRLHRTAHALRLVVPSDTGAGEAAQRNDALIRFLSRGRRWYRQITSGEAPSIQAIAKAENVTERYVARVLRGALLAPEMMQRLLEGRQLVTLTVRQLLDPPPIDWSEQRRHFGITAG